MLPKDEQSLPERLAGMRGRGDGLRTPDGDYFAELARRSLAAARETPVRQLPVRRRAMTYWLGLAAGLLLLLGVAWWALRSPTPADRPSSEELLAEIDAAIIGDYLQENVDDYDTELLYDAYTEN